MRKLVIALGTLAFMSSAAVAITKDGIVREFVPETKVITLEDGTSYTVPPDVAIPAGIAPGAKVSVTTDDDDVTKVTGVTLSP
ncbi:hypothetical protein ASC75_23820 [Aminobacter sp. DSM 101952]|uniref:DUF1344 domain-containing protein n=1 Tax=Aminobacter sp. DSM 101952 TaxID=2735891 RepID=UPI0006F95C0C|nr:DUF1344 domain-containing protein [Aminobacter sp. DSM 101952]KQU72416.1 hypothetical protein ASC75_23820 [Aminobacter sp. DSM 101952]